MGSWGSWASSFRTTAAAEKLACLGGSPRALGVTDADLGCGECSVHARLDGCSGAASISEISDSTGTRCCLLALGLSQFPSESPGLAVPEGPTGLKELRANGLAAGFLW